MKKFELFLGCLGNGITVCNKAVMEHGDLKHVAHIAACGAIKWYVDPENIPADALERIKAAAERERSAWERQLDSLREIVAYMETAI